MPHLRKKGPAYYAEFYDPCRQPARKWVPMRTRDKQAAQSRMVELDRRFARGEYDPWEDAAPQEGLTVAEALKAYLRSRTSQRAETRKSDEAVLSQLVRSLPPACALARVGPRQVRAFLDAPKQTRKKDETLPAAPRAAATRHVYLARVQTFFDFCIKQGMLRGKNPAAAVERPKVGQKVSLFLSREEYALLLKQVDEDAASRAARVRPERATAVRPGEFTWFGDAVRVTVGTGLRVSELCNLHWSAVDLDGRRLTVRVTEEFKTKSGHERTVPLAGEALATLRRMRVERAATGDGYVFTSTARRAGLRGKLDRGYVNKRFKDYVETVGLDDRHTFHSLRRTYASWLVQAGVDLYRVKELLGHADIKTTMKYAFLAPDNFAAAVERVFGMSSGDGAVVPVEFESRPE